MKATPLQQLIDRLNDTSLDARNVLENKSDYHPRDVIESKKQVMFTELAIFEAMDLLKEEKQVIVDAYEKGSDNGHDWYSNPRGGNLSAEEYFNETYQNKEDESNRIKNR
jgi:hypothetical protein